MTYEAFTSDDHLPGVKGVIDHLTHGGTGGPIEIYVNGDDRLIEEIPEDVLARGLVEFVQKEKTRRAQETDVPGVVL